MNGAFYISGLGLETQQQALNTIANNVANINTHSFKRSTVRFAEIISELDLGTTDTQNNLNENVYGVRSNVQTHFAEQGVLEATNSPMDIAIEGEGFIELTGPDGESVLWRGGFLRQDDEGFLIAENGMPLSSIMSIPIEARELVIGNDGVVTAVMPGEDGNEEIGQIKLLRVNNMNGLERLDDGFYRLTDSAEVFEVMPMEDGGGRIVQGAIERSNVDLNREMVDMMIVQRAYAANAQVVQAADQVLSIVNSLRR